jgi:hypothetical protein
VDSFELYSLEPFQDPNDNEADCDPNGPGERLQGWRILGKTTVRDESTRRRLVDAIKNGLGKEDGAKCFWPRHAIRRMNDGKPVDLLICFECHNVALYVDGKRVGDYEGIPGSLQPTFDEALRKADIPLAKKKKQQPKE